MPSYDSPIIYTELKITPKIADRMFMSPYVNGHAFQQQVSYVVPSREKVPTRQFDRFHSFLYFILLPSSLLKLDETRARLGIMYDHGLSRVPCSRLVFCNSNIKIWKGICDILEIIRVALTLSIHSHHVALEPYDM